MSANKAIDRHWKTDFDRFDQFGRVVLKVQDMLDHRAPRALAFVWYGTEGQGMKRFHTRLEARLERRLHNAHVPAVSVCWPNTYAADVKPGERRFAECDFEKNLLEAFAVSSLQEIGRSMAEFSSAVPLVVVNHPHAETAEVMDPAQLLGYLDWWDRRVMPVLNNDRQFFALGFSFRSQNPDRFAAALTRLGYDGLTLARLHVEVLPPLENIKRHDLIDFLRRHEVEVPSPALAPLLAGILDRTGGRYEETLDLLEILVECGYAELFRRLGISPDVSQDDPFGMGPPPQSQRPRVLLSYSHDSDEHTRRAADLATRLKRDGVDCVIDQDDPHPPEGFSKWMERQIGAAQFVLVVASEGYATREGASFEERLMLAEIKKKRGNERFIPILFDANDEPHIPAWLVDYEHYVVSRDADYAQLLNRLSRRAV